MAYTEPFDAATPSDADLVSGGDDAIRQLKRALNERFEDFFANWPDGDPLTSAGTSALSSGPLVDMPNPATTSFYFASDEGATGKLYMRIGTVYLAVPGQGETVDTSAFLGNYVGTNAPGTKVTDYASVASAQHLFVSGTAAAGILEVDLTEWDPDLDVTRFMGAVAMYQNVGLGGRVICTGYSFAGSILNLYLWDLVGAVDYAGSALVDLFMWFKA